MTTTLYRPRLTQSNAADIRLALARKNQTPQPVGGREALPVVTVTLTAISRAQNITRNLNKTIISSAIAVDVYLRQRHERERVTQTSSLTCDSDVCSTVAVVGWYDLANRFEHRGIATTVQRDGYLRI
jgi:hypothetical protein